MNKNIKILRSISGLGISRLIRFSKHTDWQMDMPWKGIEDLMIVLNDTHSILVTVDEGKNNVLLYERKIEEFYTYTNRLTIIEDYKGLGSFTGVSFSHIQKRGIITKEHDFHEWHAMSGIFFDTGAKCLCIGTALQDKANALFVIDKSEVDQDYSFLSLESL